MFDFGFSEMLVVAVIALVVLGPERLPVVARTAGEWIGKAQRFVAQVKSDIDRETQLSELKQLKDEAQSMVDSLQKDVQAAADEMQSSVKDVADEAAEAGAEIEKSAESIASTAAPRTTSADDVANIYGWGTPTPAYESKAFDRRYHTGPSVDELALEIDRLRRELGMKGAHFDSTIGRRRDYAVRTRSNRPRIYR